MTFGDHAGEPQTIESLARSSFPALVVLYVALYAAYGMESPFLPTFFGERGLSSGDIGLVLAAGTAVRLAAGPALGLLADRFQAHRLVLGAAAIAAGGISLTYLLGHGFWSLLSISMVHSVATASLAPLADALALAASRRETVFVYGWIRGVGSAAFVAGTLVSGQLVARFGLISIVLTSSLAFLAMSVPIRWIGYASEAGHRTASADGVQALLSIPLFRRLLLVAALIIGSHAMNDAFAVIRWRAAGLSPQTISLLWSASVVSEIVVFFVVGSRLLRTLGPARCAAVAAGAGIVRWGLMACSTAMIVLVPVQALHGLTFALMHLVAMRLIGDMVPARLTATAQAIYGTLALGLASVVLTLASGSLYGRYGGSAFWLMASLCLAALPLATTLREGAQSPSSGSRGTAADRSDKET